MGKVIKSAIIEKASIDEVYLDITEEAMRRLNCIENDVTAFNALVILAKSSSIAGEDEVEMKMSKNNLRKGHSGTRKDDEEFPILEGPNIRDWFDQPHYIWNQDDKLLLCGAIICDELRLEVLKQLNYSCSGGVAHNKMLSKIASAMHKPNKQTLVPTCVVRNMMSCIPINRVAGFGGKLGESLADFGGRKVEKFSDLLEIGKSELLAQFGDETTTWMLNAAAGIDHTPVEQRALASSIGCGKSYRQKNTLPPIALQDGRVLHWLRELSEELEERVQMDTDMNSRKPKQVTVGMSIAYVQPPKDLTTVNTNGDPSSADPVRKWQDSQGMSLSKVFPMCVGALALSKAAHTTAVRAVAESTRLNRPWNITYLSLSASGFVPIADKNKAISSFFKSAPSPQKMAILGKNQSDERTNALESESHVVISTNKAENKEVSCEKSKIVNADINICKVELPISTSTYLSHDNKAEFSDTQGSNFSQDEVEDSSEGRESCSSIQEISSYYLKNKNVKKNMDKDKVQDRTSSSSKYHDDNNSKNMNLSNELEEQFAPDNSNISEQTSISEKCSTTSEIKTATPDYMGILDEQQIGMKEKIKIDMSRKEDNVKRFCDNEFNGCSESTKKIKKNDENDNYVKSHTGNTSSHYNNNNIDTNTSEIDMDVFNALPIDMQRELSIAYKIPYETKIPISVNRNIHNTNKGTKSKATSSHNSISDILERTPNKISSFFGNQSTSGGKAERGGEGGEKDFIDRTHLRNFIDDNQIFPLDERYLFFVETISTFAEIYLFTHFIAA